jgi:NAD(P) transhydrogenase subunit alpha
MNLALLATEGGGHSLPFLLVGGWVLLLAIFAGVELISKVPPTLHTPLMSGSNAISGITIVGALYCAGTGYPLLGQVLGFAAIAMAMINVVGGFLVTDRMLRMFGTRKGPADAKKEKAP